ncbi:MAG: type II toxin-antitoxin system prevent-host-death family antitoxin [Armatimonadota bacterium]|nr:type II toxin-antitoxin system prevent-host-death family antitoxin [Armatimonadota bacterium]MDR7428236.1 type II toxin-antitoxin system prevent-host-death family antitoxin [Armatimonadota bacterium]MDR7464796.1 type II toxin-antitoxin system prevent-host-death family antitoxin [Armatimonadota bacterium]MDR7470107.1 type II toxin-antitoxin system prevent-host-death family antitoxin [Armatimonadota bacterium]MDR7474955.1 type II toxin-antitoxin system prevent-host-death family antitoxin [Arma
MKMVNTVELKNRTNALLRQVARGEAVIVTRRGKPVAALTRLTDAGLEEFVLRYASGTGGAGAAAGPQPETPPRYRYMSLAVPFGTIFVAYGPGGPVIVRQASSPAAFEREAERLLGSAPAADPEPPADLRAQILKAIRDHAPYRGPLDLSLVPPFERAVLQALRRIPPGQVRTYGQIARALGRPSAARAVGTACARNPLPLLIPCHRVVRSDGKLGGYSMRGGAALKRQLLEAEGALPALLPIGR